MRDRSALYVSQLFFAMFAVSVAGVILWWVARKLLGVD